MNSSGGKKRIAISNWIRHGSKAAAAKALDVSRSSLYYRRVLPEKDATLKDQIEEVWQIHPSYGYRRLALALGVNKKRAHRVMKYFKLKPPRRRLKRPRRKYPKNVIVVYPNLIKDRRATAPGEIWVSDFTFLPYKGSFVYLATIMDVFTREVVGWQVATTHTRGLVDQALNQALAQQLTKPLILHSDQGSEYTSYAYLTRIKELGITISFSTKASPWQNGHQESFYSQFKLDLGPTKRFPHLGELVEAIHTKINVYNSTRIHSALKMPPAIFAKKFTAHHSEYHQGMHNLSKKMGS